MITHFIYLRTIHHTLYLFIVTRNVVKCQQNKLAFNITNVQFIVDASPKFSSFLFFSLVKFAFNTSDNIHITLLLMSHLQSIRLYFALKVQLYRMTHQPSIPLSQLQISTHSPLLRQLSVPDHPDSFLS